jgi:zinc transport system permease protein
VELLEILRNPIIAGLLASVACGIIGVYVVVKRIVFISGGISHASFGGIGLGYFFGIEPILGALIFAPVSALAMGMVTRRTRLPEDTAIGVLWVFGMALGILFIFLTPGYAPNLMAYLFGDILFVSTKEIILMLILDGVIILIVSLLYKEFLAISFDEEFSMAIGMPIERLYLTLLCLVALTVVVLIRVVGIIMVIALLTIPAAMSRQFTYDLKKKMMLSIIFSIIFTVGGLWLSYFLNWPSGATIILLGVALFLASLAFSRLRRGGKSASLPQLPASS